MAVSKERMIQFAEEINTPVWIDNHTKEKIEIAAVAVLSIGTENHHIVPLLRNELFCLNGSNKDTGGVWYLSTWSLSGNMDTRGVSIEEAIETFNESYRKAGGDMAGRMHELTLVKKF